MNWSCIGVQPYTFLHRIQRAKVVPSVVLRSRAQRQLLWIPSNLTCADGSSSSTTTDLVLAAAEEEEEVVVVEGVAG